MTALYFYGTLRHLPLLETVIGRPLDGVKLTEAALPNYAIHWAAGQAFPLIVPDDGGQAIGLMGAGFSDEDVARLDYYERVFGYDLKWVEVIGPEGPQAVQMFWPPETTYEVGPEFVLADWAAKWGAVNCRAAQEVLSYRGQKTPETVGAIYGMIHARAASHVLAGSEAAVLGPSGRSRSDVEILDVSNPYANFFALTEMQLKYRRFDGEMSPTVLRAAFLGTDAALVLPYDAVRDRVLMIEQFRMGPMARGDHGPWQLEPIAGRVDPGETPEACAHREALEEAGLTLDRLEVIHLGYPSPGAVSEFYHIYLGLTDLPDDAARVAGVAGEHEDIKGHLMPLDQALEMLDAGQIRVTPLALALHWLARNRSRLRKAA